jgi:hypothetical protein
VLIFAQVDADNGVWVVDRELLVAAWELETPDRALFHEPNFTTIISAVFFDTAYCYYRMGGLAGV